MCACVCVCVTQAELDALTQRVAREAAESAAARSLADAALSQLRTHELRHAQEVEHLSKQLRQLQVGSYEKHFHQHTSPLALLSLTVLIFAAGVLPYGHYTSMDKSGMQVLL